jgi:hypothetical protein
MRERPSRDLVVDIIADFVKSTCPAGQSPTMKSG